jgi:hypothetical protein
VSEFTERNSRTHQIKQHPELKLLLRSVVRLVAIFFHSHSHYPALLAAIAIAIAWLCMCVYHAVAHGYGPIGVDNLI